MAIAEKWLAHRYNRPGFEIFDYHIYAVCGDGCLMEGVASEAASLAGHLGLDNLCWIYDNNHITIEGNTSITFTEDVATRFLGYGWNVLRVGDANDIDRIEHALEMLPSARRAARRSSSSTATSATALRTSRTPPRRTASRSATTRFASPSAATAGPRTRSSSCPTACASTSRPGSARAAPQARKQWEQRSSAYRAKYPELATEIDQMQRRELPAGWDRNLPVFPADPKGIAGREASGKVLNVLAQNIPWFLGGSADLGPSNKTAADLRRRRALPGRPRPAGRTCTSASASTRWRRSSTGSRCRSCGPFGATFFIFSDYARPAIRLSALMELPAIFVFTHEAMGDGEDGPTHQPVEQLVSLRAIPGLVTLRPGDANEVVEAYRYVMQLRHEPAVLALSRQPLPTLDRHEVRVGVRCRARRLRARRRARRKSRGDPHRHGQRALPRRARRTRSWSPRAFASRVVSMPSWEIFDHQTQEYRDSVLPPTRQGSRRGRAGLDARLGALRRRFGTRHRHEDVRRVGAAQGAAEEVRVRSGARRSDGERVVGEAVTHDP